MLSLAIAAAAAAESSESLRLTLGLPIERSLSPGAADRFQLKLEAGGHWLVSVEQRGIDVVVEVEDPRGEPLLAVDNPQGREGVESLLLTPATTGVHTLEVRRKNRGAREGGYQVLLEQLPAITPADRLRLRAEAAVTTAGQLHLEGEDDAKEQAVVKLRKALETWRALGEPRRQARALSLIGANLDRLEDRRQSVVAYGQALALWRQLDDRHAMAAAFDRLGIAHKHLGEHPQAISYLEEALALRQELGQPDREARTRNYLCLVLQKLGRFRVAGECYQQALELARELGDLEREATLLNNLGGIHQNLGEPAAALEYFQQALESWRATGGERDQAVTLNNLGSFHRTLGELEQALLYYHPALVIFEQLGNRYWQARTLNNIGSAHLSLGEPDRASAYLLRALPLRRDVADRTGEAVTLRNLGWAYSRLDQHGKALAFYRKALEHDLAAGNRRGEATTRKLLGELLAQQQQPLTASDELELALDSFRKMGKRQEEADVLTLLGRMRLDADEPRQARALIEQAHELHRAVGNLRGEVSTLGTLARILRKLGHLAAAKEHLETAIATLETQQARLTSPVQRASFLASQREVYELLVDVLMELHSKAPAKGYDVAALEASERGRSRSLLGLLEGAGAGLGYGIDQELDERLRAAERQFAAKTRRQLRVLGRDHTAEQALAVEQELYAAQSELESVRAEIRRRSPRYASLTGPQTLDARSIRELLGDNTVLLEFLLGEERSFLWWVTPTSVTAYELPPRETIEELSRQVHQQVSVIHRRNATLRDSLDTLGRMLLGPVADRLRAQRLVIVADGALHLVPFAALTLPDARQPVLTHHEVVHLPSASVLASHRRRPAGAARSEAPATVAIFADPIFTRQDPRLEVVATAEPTSPHQVGDSTPSTPATTRQAALLELDELDRLPHTRQEADAIAALVPQNRRLLATGSDARRSRVMEDGLSTYRILHFATHGFINPRNPELSGLVLSRFDDGGDELDDILGLYDVSNLELSAELVVLSGCRTALGKHVRGEGLVGLTRGFMYAGVPRVVASLWQVRDQATADLMARFYRAMLAENLPPAAALRAAQLALRQERRYRDPFYWAAFMLQGDWR